MRLELRRRWLNRTFRQAASAHKARIKAERHKTIYREPDISPEAPPAIMPHRRLFQLTDKYLQTKLGSPEALSLLAELRSL